MGLCCCASCQHHQAALHLPVSPAAVWMCCEKLVLHCSHLCATELVYKCPALGTAAVAALGLVSSAICPHLSALDHAGPVSTTTLSAAASRAAAAAWCSTFRSCGRPGAVACQPVAVRYTLPEGTNSEATRAHGARSWLTCNERSVCSEALNHCLLLLACRTSAHAGSRGWTNWNGGSDPSYAWDGVGGYVQCSSTTNGACSWFVAGTGNAYPYLCVEQCKFPCRRLLLCAVVVVGSTGVWSEVLLALHGLCCAVHAAPHVCHLILLHVVEACFP